MAKRYISLFNESFPETKKELDALLFTDKIPEYFLSFKKTVTGILDIRERLIDVLEGMEKEEDKKKVQAKIDGIDTNLKEISKKLSDWK